jgi:hypothetical protein
LHSVGDGEEGVLALLENTNEQDSTQKTDQLHDYLNRDKAADNATASNQSPQIGGLRNVSDPGWRKFDQRHSDSEFTY